MINKTKFTALLLDLYLFKGKNEPTPAMRDYWYSALRGCDEKKLLHAVSYFKYDGDEFPAPQKIYNIINPSPEKIASYEFDERLKELYKTGTMKTQSFYKLILPYNLDNLKSGNDFVVNNVRKKFIDNSIKEYTPPEIDFTDDLMKKITDETGLKV